MFDLQVRQAFDFQDTTGEDVLLAGFLNGQQALLDGVQRNGVHQVTQGDARLHFALEAYQHGFWHIQRHHTGSSGKGHQTGTSGEADADRETGVGVPTGTHGIGQQHAVQPGVDDTVARTQGHATAGADESRQFVVSLDVNWFWIGCGVAEGLHHQIGREAQASQVFQFVTSHWASGVLAANGGHAWFAVGTRTHAQAFGQTASTANHLLRQGEAFTGINGALWQTEQIGWGQTQCFASTGGQATANDQRNTATGTNFVKQNVGLDLEFGDQFAIFEGFAFVGTQFNHVAHAHFGHIQFDRQCARIFHGVVEDRSNLAAQANATKALVRNERNVFAGEPQHGVGGRFTRRTGTDHVAHVGNQVALFFQGFDKADRAFLAGLFRFDTWARVFQHGQSVQRNVRAAPGVRGGRQVVGVGLASDFEDGNGQAFRDFRAAGEPLAVSPALHHFFSKGIALFGFFLNVVERVKHQQGVFQAVGGDLAQFGRVQQLDQRADVVATQHGSQQLSGALAADQSTGFCAQRDSGQVGGFDLGGVVHTGGDAVGQQVDQDGFFTSRWVFDELDQLGGLLSRQRQRGNAQSGALGNMFAVRVQHSAGAYR